MSDAVFLVCAVLFIMHLCTFMHMHVYIGEATTPGPLGAKCHCAETPASGKHSSLKRQQSHDKGHHKVSSCSHHLNFVPTLLLFPNVDTHINAHCDVRVFRFTDECKYM